MQAKALHRPTEPLAKPNHSLRQKKKKKKKKKARQNTIAYKLLDSERVVEEDSSWLYPEPVLEPETAVGPEPAFKPKPDLRPERAPTDQLPLILEPLPGSEHHLT